MKHTTSSYMRILGNAEEELVFCINNFLRTLELNVNQDASSREEMGKTYAQEIKIVCEKYLRGRLQCSRRK